MGRIGITYQDIEQAIQILLLKQKNLTVDNIREVLGTGSKGTIARLLKEWRMQQSNVQNLNEMALPAELLGSVNLLWEKLREQMEGQANEYQQQADKQIAEAHTQLNIAITKNQELELLVNKQAQEIHDRAEKYQQLQDNFVVVQNERSAFLERLSAFDNRHQESQKELGRLHSLLNHLQENLEHYQVASHQLRQEQLLLLEKQRNEQEQLHQKIASLIQEKSLLEAQMEHLNQRYIELQREHHHIKQSLEKQQQEHQRLSLSHQALHHSQEFLLKQHQQQSEILQQKNNLEIELRAKLEKMHDKTIALSQAQEKIISLEQEKETLFYQMENIESELKQLQIIISKGAASLENQV